MRKRVFGKSLPSPDAEFQKDHDMTNRCPARTASAAQVKTDIEPPDYRRAKMASRERYRSAVEAVYRTSDREIDVVLSRRESSGLLKS